MLKYLRPIRDYMFVYKGGVLNLVGYIDSDFQTDVDDWKSTSGMVFTLEGGAVIWRSVNQSAVSYSTMEAEYIATSEATKEIVWLKKFYSNLGVIPEMDKPLV